MRTPPHALEAAPCDRPDAQAAIAGAFRDEGTDTRRLRPDRSGSEAGSRSPAPPSPACAWMGTRVRSRHPLRRFGLELLGLGPKPLGILRRCVEAGFRAKLNGCGTGGSGRRETRGDEMGRTGDWRPGYRSLSVGPTGGLRELQNKKPIKTTSYSSIWRRGRPSASGRYRGGKVGSNVGSPFRRTLNPQ